MSFDSTSYPPEDDKPANSHQPYAGENGRARRLYERLPIDTQLQICWEEGKGVRRQVRARTVDVSKFGVQVESERAIATGTLVNASPATFVPIATPSVRYCPP